MQKKERCIKKISFEIFWNRNTCWYLIISSWKSIAFQYRFANGTRVVLAPCVSNDFS
jgi:hypothetical protein